MSVDDTNEAAPQDNPLLSTDHRIPFDRMSPRHFVPAVRAALATAAEELAALKRQEGELTYDSVMGRLERVVEWPSRVFGLVGHLNVVMNSAESRAAHNEVQPEYTAFMTGLHTDAELWTVIKRYAQSEDASGLDPLRRRDLTKTVEDFRRAGADLPDAQRREVEAVRVELAKLSTKFSENVLDSTNAFELLVTDPGRLAGLPDGVLRMPRARTDSRCRRRPTSRS